MGSGSQKPHEAFVIRPAPPKGPGLSYQSAEAFDAAIKDRIAAAAAESHHSIAQLRRQFAYDRLLARLFTTQPDAWVLKGGTGLLARLPDQARHSQDIDLYFQGQAALAATELITAAEHDLKDYFTFGVEQTASLTGANPGYRFKVVAYLGAKPFAQFGVDTVVATNMTGDPEPIPHLTPVTVEGLPTASYRAYPVADHIADKHAAMLDTYSNGQPSSRYRDLVDLVVIATTQRPTAKDLHTALTSEYSHRGLATPTEVTLPSPAWEAGYAAVAAQAPDLGYPTADMALDVVTKLLNPILAGKTTGTWNPNTLDWE
ncbi:MAG: nucleotidyl transferase AbiEii/AbiGii toxin family protein [bacterium]|nr:nucleotidyl transferase AbiEii/AbiGii toxin family protein [bacterium]